MQLQRVFSGAVKLNTTRSLSSNVLDFAKQRAVYEDKVGVLRKQWKLDHEAKLEVKRLEEIEALRKLSLVSAVKLRRVREENEIKLEIYRKKVKAQQQLSREKQARSHLLFRESEGRQQRMYARAIADLEEEKEHWITLDNMDSKITEDLFATPATTGLTSRYSEFWRHSAYSTDIDRMIKHAEEHEDDDFYTKETILTGERDMAKRIEMIEFLDQSVANGAERANFKNLVDEFLEQIDELDRLDEGNEEEDGEFDYDFEPGVSELHKEDLVDSNPFESYDNNNDMDDSIRDNFSFRGNMLENGVDDEGFVNEMVPEHHVEDPGDYKKKVVDTKKKTVGRKKK